MSTLRSAAAAVLALSLAVPVLAQTRGIGRMGGVVEDESGTPIEGVQIKAVKEGETQVLTAKTNKKGEWGLGGLASGTWNLDFAKDGYETRSLRVPFSEVNGLPHMKIAIKKAVVKVDPNAEIRTDLEKAAPLMQAGKYAEARAIYEALLAKYPEAWQVEPLIARTYAGEKKPDEAITHLQAALQHDPNNVEVKLLLASVLVDQGKVAESQKYLDGIDMSQVKDPVVFLNEGISLINQGKAAEATAIFDKVVTAFPTEPEGYYYRGRAYLAQNKFPEAKADLQKFVAMPGADANEVTQANKILEMLKSTGGGS
ncbi:MAG TPA: tetratricopeptide repeat protein [Vicinamibacterales bacterium]|nr:tetratricopeptide repeat protein [Vicinamibacterales bacterium]